MYNNKSIENLYAKPCEVILTNHLLTSDFHLLTSRADSNFLTM